MGTAGSIAIEQQSETRDLGSLGEPGPYGATVGMQPKAKWQNSAGLRVQQ